MRRELLLESGRRAGCKHTWTRHQPRQTRQRLSQLCDRSSNTDSETRSTTSSVHVATELRFTGKSIVHNVREHAHRETGGREAPVGSAALPAAALGGRTSFLLREPPLLASALGTPPRQPQPQLYPPGKNWLSIFGSRSPNQGRTLAEVLEHVRFLLGWPSWGDMKSGATRGPVSTKPEKKTSEKRQRTGS